MQSYLPIHTHISGMLNRASNDIWIIRRSKSGFTHEQWYLTRIRHFTLNLASFIGELIARNRTTSNLNVHLERIMVIYTHTAKYKIENNKIYSFKIVFLLIRKLLIYNSSYVLHSKSSISLTTTQFISQARIIKLFCNWLYVN